MKKLLNSRFLIIMASTLVVLIVLVLGVFAFFNDKGVTFVKEGYILNPTSSNNERYYFDENAEYKENLSSKIVFKDVDKEEVAVNKDSFVHYLDGGISFLKNGAILDLSTINSSIANYYNIKNNSILEYKEGSYYVETTSGMLNFKNFIGRISDNKYVVAGNDINLKIAKNDNNIKGDFFEIVFVEEGIVNIENQEVKYQVAAESSFIFVGDNIVIDLGNKKITYNGKDVMSITAITIDNDENIEIIPKEEYKDNKEEDDNQNNNNNNNNINDNSPVNNNNNNNVPEPDDDDDDDGKDDGNSDVIPDVKKDIEVSLVDAKISATSIGITVDVDSEETNTYKMYMTNTNTGKRVYVTEFSGIGEQVLPTKYSLTPDTNYLITIESNNMQYFQTILKTDTLGVDFNKMYATDSSLTYNIKIDEDSLVNSVVLNLYKYSEENGEYILQKDNYDNNQSVIIKKEDAKEGYVHTFSSLDSNTKYVAILEEFNINSISYSGVYNISLTNSTLKSEISENIIPKVSVNSRTNTFTLSLEGVNDVEKSISGYTYYIYNATDITSGVENPEPVIPPIVKTNASSVTIDSEPVGTVIHDPNKLENGKNYVYNVVIEYYDNEKYKEFRTGNSAEFWVSGAPSVSLSQDNDNTTHNKLVATIDLIDNSCTVPMSGRSCYDEANQIMVTVTGKNDEVVFNEAVNFEAVVGNEKVLRYNLEVPNLSEGTTYKVKVSANKVDMRDGNVYVPYNFLFEDGRSTLETKKLSKLEPVFTSGEGGSNVDHVVNSVIKFVSPVTEENNNNEDASYTASTLESVVIKLYQGSIAGNLDEEKLLGTKVLTNNDFNLKEALYGTDAVGYNITTDGSFGLTYDDLKENDKLTEQYTIVVYAYYEDVSIYSNLLSAKEIKLTYNEKIYNVNPQLFMTEVTEPISIYQKRTNAESGNLFKTVAGDTNVGFIVSARFDSKGLISNGQVPTGATYYVYGVNSSGSLEKVNFKVLNDDNELVTIDKNTGLKLNSIPVYDSEGYVTLQATIYMDTGTELSINDDMMRRGNKYYIACEVDILGAEATYPYNSNDLNKAYKGMKGIFTEIADVDTGKQLPIITMNADHSDASSITYNYKILDVDKILSDNKLNYVVNDGEVNSLNLTVKDDLKYNNNYTVSGYEGSFTVGGLVNNDLYKMTINENILKSAEVSEEDLGEYVFDGLYNINTTNSAFEIFNNSDNRVKIKINMDSTLLNRILSYKITLTDEDSHKLSYIKPSLESCGDDSTDEFNRCISIDYTELKNAGMQTIDLSNPNNITVNLVGFYDTGMIKWVSEPEANEFYIFQNNSTGDKVGDYIVFSSSGILDRFNPTSDNLNVRTHYTYKRTNTNLTITNKYEGYNIANNSALIYTTTKEGFKFRTSGYNTLGNLNSKVVKEGNITSTNSMFNFSSITPKITKGIESSLINGSKLSMSITGFDTSSFIKEDNKFYFYVDVWASEEDIIPYKTSWNTVPNITKNTIILRTVKVEYDPTRGSNFSFIVDGLDANTTYYYTVSAYMKNGIYTQFYDGGNETEYVTKVYSLRTGGSRFYQNLQTGYTSLSEVSEEVDNYGQRTLDSVISLTGTSEELQQFYLKYFVCETDSEVCDVDTNIVNGVVNLEDMSPSIMSSVVLPTDFVYGKNYVYKLLAVYNKKDQDGNVTGENTYLLNGSNTKLVIKALSEPSFIMTRKAEIDETDGYVINVGIKLNDVDRTIVNHEYMVRITGGNNDAIMQVLDNNGEWVDVDSPDTYKFQVLDDVTNIRFRNLEENTPYEITAEATSYRNNIDLDPKTEIISKTYTVYSANSLGVALGYVDLSATSSSIVAKFLGGSSFENVNRITYTIGVWGNSEAGVISGYYDTIDRPFVATPDDLSTFRYTLSPEELLTNPNFSKNGVLLEKTYTVTLDFKIGENNVTTNELVVTYSKEDNK